MAVPIALQDFDRVLLKEHMHGLRILSAALVAANASKYAAHVISKYRDNGNDGVSNLIRERT